MKMKFPVPEVRIVRVRSEFYRGTMEGLAIGGFMIRWHGWLQEFIICFGILSRLLMFTSPILAPEKCVPFPTF